MRSASPSEDYDHDMWFRKRREPEPPTGVRIVHGDGTVSECAVILDPQRRRRGVARWFAEPPPGTAFAPGADAVMVDVLPPRSSVVLNVRIEF
jgi:hypothetical protein